ncbi:recombinase family protein [Sphaerisporangium sp. NPDC004334]
MGELLRCVCDYTRKSTDRAGTGDGVTSQHEENQELADEFDLGTITVTYEDNDVSAYQDVERPAYLRLLADMQAGKVGVVIIWHAKRLHRKVEEVTQFIKIARAHGVRLFSVSRGGEYNLNKAQGRKDLIDDTSEGEHESAERGERVAMARKRQARRGDFGGGIRPYGWGVDTGRVRSVCVNPKAPTMERIYEDRVVLDMTQHQPSEAAEIRKWASDLLAGVSMRQVLADLRARQVPTAAQSDGRTLRRKGKPVQSEGWNARTVKQILCSPRTSGHSVYQGEIVRRDVFEPIISEETRQALITMWADPIRQRHTAGNTPKWLGSLIYRCGICDDGSLMVVMNNSAGQPGYRCRSKHHCRRNVAQVDAFIEKVIITRLSRGDVADLLPRTDPTVDVAALREELALLDQSEIELGLLIARRKLGGVAAEVAQAEIDKRRAEIHADLKSATAESPFADFAHTDDPARTWRDLSLGRKRECLRLLVKVTLLPVRGRPAQGQIDPHSVQIEPITSHTAV